jgi:hypothetical protein
MTVLPMHATVDLQSTFKIEQQQQNIHYHPMIITDISVHLFNNNHNKTSKEKCRNINCSLMKLKMCKLMCSCRH